MSAMFENRRSKNSTPSRRNLRVHTFQFPNGDAKRTSVDARCRRGRVLRVRIVLYSKSIQGLYERDVRKSKIEKLYAKPSNLRVHTFQFPNGDAERTSVDARCRRGRVLRVRIVLYSKSIQGLYERDVRKSKIEKLYAKPSNPRYIPSNFRTATPRERLSMPAVAVAVSSESVSCSTVNQFKVYMSAMFENRKSKNSTPSRRTRGYLQFPNGDAERTSVDARCRRGSVLRVRIVLYSKSIQGLYERDVRKSKIEKLYAKPSNPRVPSNFRTATPRERLSTPAVAVAVSSESVSCSTVNQFKVYMSAMFENRKSKNSTPSRRTRGYPISERRRRENVCRCPLSPWQCPPSLYRALQ